MGPGRYQTWHISRGFGVGHQANLAAVREILPSWVDHLQESFSSKEVHIK